MRHVQIQCGAMIAVLAIVLTQFVLDAIGVPRAVLAPLATLCLVSIFVWRVAPILIRWRLMRLRSSDSEISFHAELFDLRNAVLELLAKHEIVWLGDFGAIDLRHDTYGFEVTGIHSEDASIQVERLLRGICPWWWWRRRYYEDMNVGELGWKVVFSKLPDFTSDEKWKSDSEDS